MTQDIIAIVNQHIADANVVAFMQMIRFSEGTNNEQGYTELFGGSHFENFDTHPKQTLCLPAGIGRKLCSDAAGAYQIMGKTFDGLVAEYGNDFLPDFKPETQDKMCCLLLCGRGAFMNVVNGQFETAVTKCALEWASLPNSPYGQPTHTMEVVQAEYEKNGGVIA